MTKNKENMMNGLLLIDKPPGVTSHDVVHMVRKRLKARKVGHTGTLDPFATGLMILCIGTATRLARFVGKEDKIYEGQISLGLTTDTYDVDGRVTSSSPTSHLTRQDIQKAARTLTGKIRQVPPSFSAKRVAGKRAYELARHGKTVPLKPKEISVSYFKIMSLTENIVDFEAKVSSGTYVRSLASDLGKILGCGGTLINLRRISSGNFHVHEALKVSEMKKMPLLTLREKIVPLSQIPLAMRLTRIEEAGRQLFLKGNPVPETYFVDRESIPLETEVKVTTKRGEFLGIGIISQMRSQKYPALAIQPKIVFE